jgi:uncharacterized protein (DUF952 family)
VLDALSEEQLQQLLANKRATQQSSRSHWHHRQLWMETARKLVEGGVCVAFIYKLMMPEQWRRFKADKMFQGTELDGKDGYIHACTADQVTQIHGKFFGASSVTVLKLDVSKIVQSATVKMESKLGGTRYPHIYMYIPLDAVVAVNEFARGRHCRGFE